MKIVDENCRIENELYQEILRVINEKAPAESMTSYQVLGCIEAVRADVVAGMRERGRSNMEKEIEE